MEGRSRIRRWALPVVAVGFAVVIATTPVGAHVTDNTTHVGAHVWKDFIRAQTLKLFYTKSASDARFINTSELLWAKVDADLMGTTVLGGRGVVGASRVGVGIYRVDFNRDVNACGWVATLNDNLANGSAPGEISVELAGLNAPAALWVRTYNSAGTHTEQADDDGFTVQVTC